MFSATAWRRRGIPIHGTLSGPVVFKTLHGWEEHRLLPIYPNNNGSVLHMSLELIGACPHQDTDKKRTIAHRRSSAPGRRNMHVETLSTLSFLNSKSRHNG